MTRNDGADLDLHLQNLFVATKRKNVPFKELEFSLKKIEKLDSRRVDVQEIEGSWELIFSTSFSSGYLPVSEIFTLDFESKKSRIDTSWGPFPLGSMLGSCSWNGEDASVLFCFQKYELGNFFNFDINPPEKTYTYFWIKDGIALAKSSAGGYTILRKANA